MGYRRRLTSGRGNYARTMGYTPVPFTRKRKFTRPPTTTGGGAPVRMGRRVRPRMARSYVITKTKTKRRAPQVNTHGDNQSSSVNSIGKKWLTRFDKMMMKKIVSPQTVFLNATGNAASTQGKQNNLSFSFMTKSTLTALETAANGGVSTNNPVKFFLKNGKSILRLRNCVNTNCKLSIYDIVTKRAPPDTTLDTPNEAWVKGVTDFGTATGANTVGQTPYRSPEFNQYYSVNRVTTVSLEPGQQHDHTVYHRWNRIVDSIQFQNNVSQALPGLTRFVMIVFHGTLGHESATPNNVTYMPITLDYANSYEYTYGWIEKTQKAYTITDNNLTTVTTFNFAGESGDIDANIMTA